jgi:hypothetical protein
MLKMSTTQHAAARRRPRTAAVVAVTVLAGLVAAALPAQATPAGSSTAEVTASTRSTAGTPAVKQPSKTDLGPRAAAPRLAPAAAQAVSGAVDDLPGCQDATLAANDDGSTGPVPLPFPVNLWGTTYTQLYVNNNGNVTFKAPLADFTPFNLTSATPPLIAPFFADVDTRGEGSREVTYGVTTFQGRQAFCVNWVEVGYYAEHADRTNSFQLLLVDRSATGVGNFDIVMNYDRLVWETGDASGGVGGLGGTSAAAGYSSGSDGSTPATGFFQFPGSLDNGALLDTNPTGLANTSTNSTVTGRHVFPVRGGTPVAGMRCTIMGTAGNDVLRGTPGVDIICGRSGNDRLLGGDGADRLVGGPGDDQLRAGYGDDVLSGDTGNDRLSGGPGADRLNGGPGDDTMIGAQGIDRCDGGLGAADIATYCETVTGIP